MGEILAVALTFILWYPILR